MAAPAPAVQVTEHGAARAAVDLHALGERGSDIRRVSEKVRSVYRKSNERRFAGLASWPKLADSTKEEKARLGLDPRPERRTNALYRSLTSARASQQIDKRDPTELRFGTTVPYAGFQHGTSHQPARDLIHLTYSERKQIDGLVEAYVAKGRA